jgi:hypothetical protein
LYAEATEEARLGLLWAVVPGMGPIEAEDCQEKKKRQFRIETNEIKS